MKDEQFGRLPIIEQLKKYVSTEFRFFKYQAVEKGTAVAADIIADLVVIFCFLMAFLFASVTLACFLAYVLGSNWAGFGFVGLLYLVIAVLVMILKKALERPIINVLISKLLKNECRQKRDTRFMK